jgi:hypothetical protein
MSQSRAAPKAKSSSKKDSSKKDSSKVHKLALKGGYLAYRVLAGS